CGIFAPQLEHFTVASGGSRSPRLTRCPASSLGRLPFRYGQSCSAPEPGPLTEANGWCAGGTATGSCSPDGATVGGTSVSASGGRSALVGGMSVGGGTGSVFADGRSASGGDMGRLRRVQGAAANCRHHSSSGIGLPASTP